MKLSSSLLTLSALALAVDTSNTTKAAQPEEAIPPVPPAILVRERTVAALHRENVRAVVWAAEGAAERGADVEANAALLARLGACGPDGLPVTRAEAFLIGEDLALMQDVFLTVPGATLESFGAYQRLQAQVRPFALLVNNRQARRAEARADAKHARRAG